MFQYTDADRKRKYTHETYFRLIAGHLFVWWVSSRSHERINEILQNFLQECSVEFYYRSERVLEGALCMKVSNSGHLISLSGPLICRCRNCWCCLCSNHGSQSSLTSSYTPFTIITSVIILTYHRNNHQYIYRCWCFFACSHIISYILSLIGIFFLWTVFLSFATKSSRGMPVSFAMSVCPHVTFRWYWTAFLKIVYIGVQAYWNVASNLTYG
jgi:hypothetical protein